MRLWGLVLLLMTGVQGCALGIVKSIHDVSYLEQKPVPSGAVAREVKKEASQNVILGLTFDVDYVNEGWKAFQATCSKGTILNPMVRYSTDLGFFAYKHKLYFSGTCIEGREVE